MATQTNTTNLKTPLQNLEEWEDFLKERYPEVPEKTGAFNPGNASWVEQVAHAAATRVGRTLAPSVVTAAATVIAEGNRRVTQSVAPGNFDSLTHPNRVEGGKRPRSSMSPTIVLDHGKPFLALGSPGGSTIITTVLQILFDRLDEHMSLPDAIADPRASQRNTTRTSAEPAFILSPRATLLLARGQQFVNGGEIGAATGIEFLADGRVLAAAEPVRRGGGSAMVEFPG